ncbi:MAG: NAD(P)H-hydrate epimerase [Prolixibacteraceae bacterium]|nr:NAD(P)H-hydrate epimerase [Prolixibacteraceae bacterium]
MSFPEININKIATLPIETFREMDFLAVRNYNLPIELMMENAGLNLARLAASLLPEKGQILIGVGTGNNGGGGLVAARRLAAWGFEVFLDIPDQNLKKLPASQLKKALTFGAKTEKPKHPKLFIDAYFGFSQRLPLPAIFEKTLETANQFSCPKISLDLPSGFNKHTFESLFKPDAILTLAAMKTELVALLETVQIFVADLGIPSFVYKEFKTEIPDSFKTTGILQIKP